jgi:hypothetical protein
MSALGRSAFAIVQEKDYSGIFAEMYQIIFGAFKFIQQPNVKHNATITKKTIQDFLGLIQQQIYNENNKVDNINLIEKLLNKIFSNLSDNKAQAIVEVIYSYNFCREFTSIVKMNNKDNVEEYNVTIFTFYSDLSDYIIKYGRVPYVSKNMISKWKENNNSNFYINMNISMICAYDKYLEVKNKIIELKREQFLHKTVVCDISHEIYAENINRISKEIKTLWAFIDQKSIPVFLIWRLLNLYIYRNQFPDNLEEIIVHAMQNIYENNKNNETFMKRLLASNIFFTFSYSSRKTHKEIIQNNMYKFAECLVREFGKELFKLIISEMNRDIEQYYHVLHIIIHNWGKYICDFTPVDLEILYNVSTFINLPNFQMAIEFNPELNSMYSYFCEQIIPKFLTSLTQDYDDAFTAENLDKIIISGFQCPTEYIVDDLEEKKDDEVVENKYDDITLNMCHTRFAYLVTNKKYLLGEDNELFTTVILQFLKYLNVKNFISLSDTDILAFEKESTIIAMNDVYKLSRQTAKLDEDKRKLTSGLTPPCIDGSYGECVICMDDFTEESKCVKCKNEHYIHVKCYKSLDKNICPICRENYL